jgi:hypothetical protein
MIRLDRNELHAVTRCLVQDLEYVHEGRTVRQVEKMVLMKALKKLSPKDHRRIIRYMKEQAAARTTAALAISARRRIV